MALDNMKRKMKTKNRMKNTTIIYIVSCKNDFVVVNVDITLSVRDS
jgi:hypothetical protein